MAASLATLSALGEAALGEAARGWPVFPCCWPDAQGRCACGRGHVGRDVGKAPLTKNGFKDASTDPVRIRQWWSTWPKANPSSVTGAVSGLLVLDVDPDHGGAESLAALEGRYGRLPETVEALTGGGGRHLYFSYPTGATIHSSAGRLAPGLDIRGQGGYVVAPPALHLSGRRYEWEATHHPDDISVAEMPLWLLGQLQEPASGGNSYRPADEIPGAIREGQRNTTLASLAGSMRRRGMSETEILAALLVVNQERCVPPLDEDEVRKIVESVCRYAPADEPRRATPIEPPWPAPLDEAALHGLAGEIVRAIAPVTEAAPVAILANILAAYGSIIGPDAHVRVGHDRHPTRLFFVQVGATSKGRKRTGWSEPREIAIRADTVWPERLREGGLSSGEGLIFQVRDPVYKRVRDKKTREWDEECVDEGEPDKRLFVLEEEFAQALAVMRREGNILSPIIRQAWDTGNLAPMVKNNPTKATGAHITIVGHITRDELRARIDDTSLLNGFANRYIWLAVRRENILPEGGGLDEEELRHWGQRLATAVEFGRQAGELRRDAEARELWATVYGPLSEGKPGLLGAALARAEAQVLRLSLAHALLDCSTVIKADHLLASLALWRYSEDSARWIFGDALGSPTADAILEGLRRNGSLTRTDIVNLFGRHASRGSIDLALGLLLSMGKARSEQRETGGRPAEVWHAT